MIAPSIGQPYNAVMKFSVGDPDSTSFDSDAYHGVVVSSMTPGYEEPTTILDDNEQYKLTAYLKAVNAFLHPIVAAASVEFRIQPVSGGAVIVLGPYTPGAIAAPTGSAPAVPGLQWYQAATPTQGALAADTYRVLTLVKGTGAFSDDLAAFHEFILMVTS